MDTSTAAHAQQPEIQGQGVPGEPRAAAPRPLAPGLRRLLFTASVLVLLAGIQLFVFTGQTSHFFAFTIANPLAATFLGAAYWAAVPIEALAARQPRWANARIAVPAVLVFTVLTLAATLTHLGQLHLGARFAIGTQIVTVAWIAIYVLVPALMLILLAVQARTPGTDPPRSAGLPAWLYAVLALQAIALLGPGAAVALGADPDDGSGDRRLADQPGGGCRARAAGAGRAPPAARRCRGHPARRAAVHRARALPAPVRLAVRPRDRLPDLPGHDAADWRRGPGPRARLGVSTPPCRSAKGATRPLPLTRPHGRACWARPAFPGRPADAPASQGIAEAVRPGTAAQEARHDQLNSSW